VIGVARGVTVFAYAEPVDMRKSFNTLAALVIESLKHDVLTGDLYLFVSRDRKRAKVLYFDGRGSVCSRSGSRRINSLPSGSRPRESRSR
jgi:transposase